jgi:galactokinase
MFLLRLEERIRETLAASGLDIEIAERIARRGRSLAGALGDDGPDDGRRAVIFVPGRVEILGKHTDYAGGRSVTCAIDRGIVLAVRPRRDDGLRILHLDRGEEHVVQIDGDDSTAPHWLLYPRTVVRRLARNFPEKSKGAEIAISSDLPLAAGLSSSSALIIATFLALEWVDPLIGSQRAQSSIRSSEDLVEYLASIESGKTFRELPGDSGVGTSGGSEDHTAILLARPSRLGQYTYSPVRAERWIALDDEYSLVIASSGVVAEKSSTALAPYQRLVELARSVVEISNSVCDRSDPHLEAAVGPNGDRLGEIVGALRRVVHPRWSADALSRRAEHHVLESLQRIPRLPDRIDAHTIGVFAETANASHDDAARLLDHQVPETLGLVTMAREIGAPAASAFGAGFGGSVWAIARRADAKTFAEAWRREYARRFPSRAGTAAFFVARPSPGARTIA